MITRLVVRTGIAIFAFCAFAAAAQDSMTIRVPVRLVTVPTLVLSSRGRIIAGLNASDFQLFDNGLAETITLDSVSTPVSVAVVVQQSRDVRAYTPFIAKVGSVIDALLVGERGHAAVIGYNDNVAVLKTFNTGDVRSTLRAISPKGYRARLLDGVMQGIALLKDRPRTRARVLLLIGQPLDRGSQAEMRAIEEEVWNENISVYALALPEIGKGFASDTFMVQGISGVDRADYTTVNLERLIPKLERSAEEARRGDPFSVLTSETGGTQLHFRKQSELEQGISIVGIELRSEYLLSYRPTSVDTGYHRIHVEVGVPGVKAYARPGYRVPQ
jgi:VWFA-related protein